MTRRARRLLVALACAWGLTSVGHAAPPPKKKAPPKVIELDAMVIEGRLAKPQVFYVLGRSRFQYERLELKRSFVDRIVESAKKNPF